MEQRRFAEYADRTKRRFRQEGIDPKRFDRWLKLKDETRALVDRKTYARGFTAVELAKEARRAKVAKEVIAKLKQTPTKNAVNPDRVRSNVNRMSVRELRAAQNMTGAEYRRRAGRKASKKNNFWY